MTPGRDNHPNFRSDLEKALYSAQTNLMGAAQFLARDAEYRTRYGFHPADPDFAHSTRFFGEFTPDRAKPPPRPNTASISPGN